MGVDAGPAIPGRRDVEDDAGVRNASQRNFSARHERDIEE
jgi:hypothetical protein